MNRKAFYDNIRPFFDGFKGAKGKGQIQGLDAILNEAETRPMLPRRWLAYMLATVFHETAATMQPVKEAFWMSEAWRKVHLRYYPYYGRGLVQLTWEYNYKKAGDKLGLDMVDDPDIALELSAAVTILFEGMLKGWFTGLKLGDFHVYTRMRQIINGTDQAKKIAGYAERFEQAIKAAS